MRNPDNRSDGRLRRLLIIKYISLSMEDPLNIESYSPGFRFPKLYF